MGSSAGSPPISASRTTTINFRTKGHELRYRGLQLALTRPIVSYGTMISSTSAATCKRDIDRARVRGEGASSGWGKRGKVKQRKAAATAMRALIRAKMLLLPPLQSVEV